MLLPPKTMGTWEADTKLLAQRPRKVVKVFLVFEYATLFGNVALVRIEPNSTFTKSIQAILEPFSSALHGGNPKEILSLFQVPRNGA